MRQEIDWNFSLGKFFLVVELWWGIFSLSLLSLSEHFSCCIFSLIFNSSYSPFRWVLRSIFPRRSGSFFLRFWCRGCCKLNPLIINPIRLVKIKTLWTLHGEVKITFVEAAEMRLGMNLHFHVIVPPLAVRFNYSENPEICSWDRNIFKSSFSFSRKNKLLLLAFSRSATNGARG